MALNDCKQVNDFAEDTPIKRYLNKFSDTIYKVSLIFHIIDNITYENIKDTKLYEYKIDICTLEKAIKFMNYLYETAKYLYSDEIDLVVNHAKEILKKSISQNRGLKDGFTASKEVILVVLKMLVK